MAGGIHSRNYREQREAKRLEWRRQKRACAICGKSIDYDLPREDKQHFQLDHILSRKARPDLEFVPSNWQPTHAFCNKLKSSGQLVLADLGETSESW